jgi:steroid delta-isomerase-like uncharacterized protein
MRTRSQKKQPAKSQARSAKRRSVPARKAKKPSKVAKPKRGNAHDLKLLSRRWFEELWNQRNAEVLNELLDPAAVGETEGGLITGHEEFRQKLHAPLLGAFPDLRVTVDDVIADGNDAAVRWTFEATHGGDTLGIPASNRRVKVSGMSWLRYKDGRLVAGWDRWNADGLLAYLKDGKACATVMMADAR